MTYSLEFVQSALKEWRKLAPPIRAHLKRKLAERLEQLHVPSARLRNLPDCYKIKLRAAGYRLVYQVDDTIVVVVVIAIGKRDKNEVYRAAAKRSEKSPTYCDRRKCPWCDRSLPRVPAAHRAQTRVI